MDGLTEAIKVYASSGLTKEQAVKSFSSEYPNAPLSMYEDRIEEAIRGREKHRFDEVIARVSFKASLEWLEELKACETPIPFGRAQRFKALLPKRSPDEILEEESPYWWAYAETVREFKELLDRLPKQDFVEKKRNK
jgi:hypothetical protein